MKESVTLPVPPTTVKLHDIAIRAGVSRATVSRALHNDPSISPNTTEHVQAIARELGYNPAHNNAALRLALRKQGQEVFNRVIALALSPHFPFDAYSLEVFRGISETLTALKYTIALVDIRAYQASKYDSPLSRGEIDGLIAMHHGELEEFIESIQADPPFGQRPIVTINNATIAGCSSVRADDKHGAYLATRHLLKLGHRHIAHSFTQPEYRQHVIERRIGIEQAIVEFGLDPTIHLHTLDMPFLLYHQTVRPPSTWLHTAPDERIYTHTSIDSFPEYLKQHPEITAYLVDDCRAAMTWYTLRQAGFRIPEEFSLVGFDDYLAIPNEFGDNLLSTVHVPLFQMGQEAARILVDRIEKRKTNDVDVVLPTHLVERASTAPPRKH